MYVWCRVPVFFLYTMSVLTDLSGIKKFMSPFFSFLLALSKTKHGRLEVMRMLVFDDFSYITRHVGVPKMEGVSDAQQVELEQTQTRFLRLIDEAAAKMNAKMDAQWMELCLNDEMLGSKMESVPDVQQVEVDQIVAQVPHVNE